MNNGFVENGFIIDLGNAKDASEIVLELSNILDMPEARNKNICLKLGGLNLSQSQLLSIKALINSMDSELSLVDTTSEQTELAALNLGIIVTELKNEIEVPQEEVQEAKIEEFEIEPKEGLSYEIIEQETFEEKETLEIVEKTEEEIQAEEKLEELFDDETQKQNEEKDSAISISKLPTLYINQTLRSGQTMSFDGNIVIIGDVHPGSEIIATGDITVWGVLGGIAHAGARGNDFAKIRALKIHAIQLRISGYYARRPDSMNIPFIQRTNEFTPETAKVENAEITIYKTYEE